MMNSYMRPVDGTSENGEEEELGDTEHNLSSFIVDLIAWCACADLIKK